MCRMRFSDGLRGGAVCCELGLRGRWLDAIIGKHVVAAVGPPPRP